MISPGPQGSEVLNVLTLDGDREMKTIMRNAEPNMDLDRCEWATESRLVCRVSGVDETVGPLIGYSRLFAIGDDGGDGLLLTPRLNYRSLGIRQDGGAIVALDVAGESNRILMTKAFVPELTIGTRMASSAEGLGVEEVDVETGKRRQVERADRDAVGYVADDQGNIRMKVRHPSEGTGNLGNRELFYYRDAGSDKWQLLSQVDVNAQSSSGFYPVAVDAGRNVAFGFDEVGGYQALLEVPLTGTGEASVVLARNDVDVDSLIRIGRQRRVVGASYASEKRAAEYFDPELKKLAAALHEALPGKPLIDFAGASADESKLLVIASSDTDPGLVYLYDKQTRQLEELLALRESLTGREMGKMEPVSFPASDGTAIPGYLTLPPGSTGKNLPAIVLPHGGPSARDEWGFDWLVQFFAARGYAVLQPNFRGSSGYGNAWFGKNGFQAWDVAIGDINDAGRWLVGQGIADPARLGIVGWSYGGYAALQSQVADPKLYKAVVAIAPVTDLEQLREDARPYNNYSLVDDFIGHGPFVQAGSPAQHADAFSAPVLLFHGTLDQNVAVGQSRMMANRLRDAGKQVDYVEFKGLDHSLSDGDARAQMLTRIDGFLAASLGK